MNRPVTLGAVLSLIAGVVGVYVVLNYPDERIPTVVSLTSGVAVTLFTAYVVYLLQYPSFKAWPAPSETRGRLPGSNPYVATTRWVHLLVQNKSTGFLGGGTASNVGGVVAIRVGGGERRFATKWERQRNPLAVSQVVVAGNTVLQVSYDDAQVETAKRETLDPGEVKSLDVAFKTRGDRCCFVSIPENFRFPDLKNPETALDPGVYPFDLYIEYRHSLRKAGSFIIRNDEGTEPDTLSVERA